LRAHNLCISGTRPFGGPKRKWKAYIRSVLQEGRKAVRIISEIGSGFYQRQKLLSAIWNLRLLLPCVSIAWLYLRHWFIDDRLQLYDISIGPIRDKKSKQLE
jgi:hypothetical protein